MKSSLALGEAATGLLDSVDLSLSSCVAIQSLWAGYGHICRIEATPQSTQHDGICRPSDRPISLILKYISPPVINGDAEPASPNESHIRKILSYQVEQFFYTHLAPQMPSDIAVASCVASTDLSTADSNVTAMVLSDLREEFPLPGEKRASLNAIQTDAALEWLAKFHGFWLSKTPRLEMSDCVKPPLEHYQLHHHTRLPGKGSVWLNGGYTYLATRRTEFESLLLDSGSEWSVILSNALRPGDLSIAESIAVFLAPSLDTDQEHLTLLHGDVKSENLFTTDDGKSVAFYDFQYVGLGYGVCDLAKFFTCSVPVHMLHEESKTRQAVEELSMQPGEEALLRAYLSSIRQTSGRSYDWSLFVKHWETALVDWLRFQASWGFWGNTEWLEARVRSIVQDEDWKRWLAEETDKLRK